MAKVGDAGLDVLRFKGGFTTDGITPTSLSSMRFAFGPVFARSVAGAQLVQKGDRFTFKAVLDFRREVVSIKAKRFY